MATTRRKTKTGGALVSMLRKTDARPHLIVRLEELDGKLEAWPEPSVRVNQPSVDAHALMFTSREDAKESKRVMLQTLVETCVRSDSGEALFTATEEVEEFAEVCPGPYMRVVAALQTLLEQFGERVQAAKNGWRPTRSSAGVTSSRKGSANPSE